MSAYNKAYYLKHRERLLTKVALWAAANRPRRSERRRRTWSTKPQSTFDKYLRKTYGITFADYERMLAEQGGVCAICRMPEQQKGKRRLSVDHDHDTNKIRGLLCAFCNFALAFVEDAKRLSSGLEYLRKKCAPAAT